MDGQQQIGDPIEKLYNVVKGKGYYTKSLNEFKTQYSTPEQIDKIYNVVSGDKLYTKSKQDFYNQYFPTPEKKSKVDGASPIVLNGDGPESLKENDPNPFSYEALKPKEDKDKFVKSVVPKSIAEGVQADKRKDDSVIGGIFNTIVSGVASMGGGFVETQNTLIDAAGNLIDRIGGTPGLSKAIRKTNPIMMQVPERQEVVDFVEKARTASSSRENEAARSQFDITNGVQASDVKALMFSAPKTVVDMAAGAMSAGTSFFFQSVNDNAAELEKVPEANKLTPNEKMGYLFVQGTVQGALEKYGLNKILKATGLSAAAKQKIANEVTQEFIKKGVKATAIDIEKAALKKVSSLPSLIKRVGIKSAIGFGAEGGTEALQQLASDGAKLLVNDITGKKPFDEKDITANFVKNMINAAAQGGVFGGVGGGAVGGMQNTGKAIRAEIAKAQTPEDIQKIQQDIAEQVEAGNITPQEAEAANITTEQYAKMAAKIPGDLDSEKKYALIGGIEQREGIKKEIESVKKDMTKLDESFHDDLKAQVELLEAKLGQTNDYLEGIVTGKKPTYRKEKSVTEGGEDKYYKTSSNGEETKITKEYYDLATAVREEQAVKNKETKEVKELSPEEIIIQEAGKDKLGAYGAMVRENAALAKDVILDYAKQKYGLSEDGSDVEGGGRELPSQKIDEAVTKAFPDKESVVATIKESTTPMQDPQEGATEGVVPSTLKGIDEVSEVKALFNGDKTTEDIVNGLKNIVKDSSFDKDADTLIPYLKNNPEIKFSKMFSVGEGEVHYTGDWTVLLSQMRDKNKLAKTVLHELYHAISINELKNNADFNSKVSGIVAEAREAIGVPDSYFDGAKNTDFGSSKSIEYYGLLNNREFIAELFSNKRFSEMLDKTKIGEESILDKIVFLIKKTLGLSQKTTSEKIKKIILSGLSTKIDFAKDRVSEEVVKNYKNAARERDFEYSPYAEQQQSTPTNEAKPKIRITADELEAAQPKSNEKTETTGIPDQTKTTSEQPTEPNKAGSEAGESQEMRLAHADTERIYQEAGLPLRLETPTKHRAELEKEADEILRRGYDFNRVAEETMDGTRKWEDTDQVLFARKVADLIAKQNRTDIQSPEFDRLQSEIEKLSRASDLAGTIGARFLESRKGYRPVEESISDFVTIEKESAGVDELTPTQKENLKKEYDDLHQAKADFEAYKAKKEAEFATKQAESKVSEVKATTKKTKKTHEDFVKERKDIVADMKEKLRKARGDTSVTIVPYAKELFAIAPDVAKLTKSLVEEGISKLEDIVKEVHATLSSDMPNVTEKDVRDIIAGEYNEKKKTRNQLAANMFELKREAKLVNQLDALFKEPEPKTEKARVEKNKKVADLKKQIKDIQSFEKEVATQKEEKLKQSAKEAEATGKELDKAEKEIAVAEEKERKQKHAEAERERKQLERQFEQEKRAEEKAKIKLAVQEAKRIEKELSFRTPEEKALDRMKATIQKNLEKIEGQIKSGDFSKEEKKQPIKLDKEGHELRDKLMKLQQARDVRLLLQQRQQEGKGDRLKRWIAEVGNVPRTLMTIADFSALLRQNIFFSAGHPLRTAAAVPGMFKSFVSQTVYDRWFADLKDSPRYEIIKDSKLAIADSLSHDLSKREEDFMSSLAEKIPIIGRTLNIGKAKIPGLNIVKGSERSYTMLLNKMRVDMFNFFAESLEKRGITYENSPEVYKATAEYINNATGRSDFGKTLNKVAPVLNTAFFSPRLIASRVNMLTYWAQPRFWKTLPKEARIDYFRNWASLLAVGGTFLSLASLAGADVEEDPRSSDFGKIKDGDTRWDIWGGAQPYIRVFAQVASGKGKSSTTGGIYTMSQKERWLGKPGSFLRNKLAPVPGAVFDLLSGETGIGEKIVYEWGGETNGKEISIDQYVKERLLPMTITGTAEAMKDQGVKGLFTVGIPNVFGVGTQTYGSSPTTTSQRQSKPKGRTRDRKPTKSN